MVIALSTSSLSFEWFKSYRADTILTQKLILTKFKGNISKLYLQELWFLHSACHPMLFNISMKFHEDILNGLKVIERTQYFITETATYKVQRCITLKIVSKSYGSCALHVV